MRLYPSVPLRRTRTLAADAAVLAALILFALLGNVVHDAVDELAGLGRGVRDAGTSVQRGFDSAADATADTPLVGGKISEGLREAGRGSGGSAAAAGTEGERSVQRLANLLGWLVFGLPALILLQQFLPGRVRQVRTLTSGARVLEPASDPERRRLIAMRAAFSLPYGTLLRHTRDPLGDLAHERYDGLVRAALDDAGLRERG